jgi:hypothetical protein
VTTTAPPPAPARPPSTGPRVGQVLLALVAVPHALLVLAQPVLIGGYLDGRFDLLTLHGVNGSLLPFSAVLVLAAAGLLWGLGGRGWPTAAAVVLCLLEWVQMVLGWTRVLSAHVLVGVLVVAGAVALATWACSPAARRPRRGWWS